ncbi:hypothetical protein [Vreelandella salicampi]|uniref:Uncharacterized protein n=1 Tax=Vreelandella salicampi TaxID=1449798 RepID=A0A7Z0LP75_9GAMM|nr:hypothetical protein [Halomonas salicampi]NYS62594.1 hypothetical protein [Halomonas salicampi]
MRKAKLFDLIPVEVHDDGLWDVDADGAAYFVLSLAAGFLLRIYTFMALDVLITEQE